MKKFYLYDPRRPAIVECFFVGVVMFVDCGPHGFEPIRLDLIGDNYEEFGDFVIFKEEDEARMYLSQMNGD